MKHLCRLIVFMGLVWISGQMNVEALTTSTLTSVPKVASSNRMNASVLTTGTLTKADLKITTVTLTTTPTLIKKTERTAIEELRLLEEKNKNVKTMIGRFTQTKTSELFLEEHTYQGRFYYVKPNQFRIDYTGKDGQKDESTMLMLDNEMWDYVPSIQQAQRINLKSRSGHQREINQILLGFGVQAQKALEYFDVTRGAKDPSDRTFTLIFKARNPDETMQFVKATITFEKATFRPQTIILDENNGDQTKIVLGEVEYNAEVKSSLFKPQWPKGTEIIEQ